MAEKTYNLKLTAKELYHLQWGITNLRDNFEDDCDYYNDSKKVVENLEKRFEKKDYTEICWGKKTNETLKKKNTIALHTKCSFFNIIKEFFSFSITYKWYSKISSIIDIINAAHVKNSSL